MERERLAHERERFRAQRQDLAREDFLRAGELLGQVALTELRLEVRQQQAREARRAMLKVELIVGEVDAPELEELLDALNGASETQLDRAVELWPEVERATRHTFTA